MTDLWNCGLPPPSHVPDAFSSTQQSKTKVSTSSLSSEVAHRATRVAHSARCCAVALVPLAGFGALPKILQLQRCLGVVGPNEQVEQVTVGSFGTVSAPGGGARVERWKAF